MHIFSPLKVKSINFNWNENKKNVILCIRLCVQLWRDLKPYSENKRKRTILSMVTTANMQCVIDSMRKKMNFTISSGPIRFNTNTQTSILHQDCVRMCQGYCILNVASALFHTFVGEKIAFIWKWKYIIHEYRKGVRVRWNEW